MNKITIRDIAKQAGVSTATVSRVLNNSGYVSEMAKTKVLSVVNKLNYQPNAIARSLKIHRTNTIGVVIPDISNPYFMKISKGIEDAIEKNGYILFFVSGDENPKKEEKMLEALLKNRVDAIVIATSGQNDEMILNVKASGLPVVLIDRKLETGSDDLNLVVEDNVVGAYQLTKYLIEQGHRQIGVINGSLKVSTGIERYLGYTKALKEYGLNENPELVFNGGFTEVDGVKAIKRFFGRKDKPTAVLSFNNTMTFGAILQLNKMGVKIPDDIVVASYGETEVSQLFTPPGIVSIKQSPYEMGVCVGDILLNQLEDNTTEPVHEIYNPILDVST